MPRYDRIPSPTDLMRESTPRDGPVGVPNMGGFANPEPTQPRPVAAPPAPAAGRPGPAPGTSPRPAQQQRAPRQPAQAPIMADPLAELRASTHDSLVRFGSFPGMDDPEHPPPPIREGMPAFNPFAPPGAGWIE